ncbi:hypothetical protein QTH97_26350 [Variovorax sp. J22R24]|uniref:hypothetical protein n=1 Tax=Variovorax gracilis TaxID=3053502 RepID=UPI002577C85B|nr:hypothetical protein [Variovorax sp. J22R24]MDM0108497.1 hypothetical protein [Variovorax sp. J22R24]
MPTLSTQQLAHLDDEEVARLAAMWRARALRGDREANGIAHAFEVERRRRTRASYLAQLPPEPPERPRPWWKFWGAPYRKNSESRWPP